MKWFKRKPPARKVVVEAKDGRFYDAEVLEDLGAFVKIRLLTDTDTLERGADGQYHRVRSWEVVVVPTQDVRNIAFPGDGKSRCPECGEEEKP